MILNRRVRFLRTCLAGLLSLLCLLTTLPVDGQEPAPSTPAATSTAAQSEEDWNVIYMGKTRVGYSRSLVLPIQRDGRELIRSESETMMSIKRFGQQLTMKLTITTEETTDGELLSVDFTNDNPPASHTKTTGKVVGDKLQLTITNARATTKKSIPWDKANKSPAWQDRMLRDNPLKADEQREFDVFLPEMNKVARVTLKSLGEEETEVFGGARQRLTRVDITQSVLPGFVTKTWIDTEGRTIKSSTGGFFGSSMSTYRVSRDEALKEITGAELDIAMDTLIKITPPIERAHESRQIVYQVTIKGHDPAKEIPNSSTQHIRSTGPEQAELTVTRIIPDQPSNQPVPKGFLEANSYLQTQNQRVIDHAIAATGEETDPLRIATRMEQYVHEKLDQKNFSTALGTAAEVAESLEGDCTEHAVLLAAMCRVKHIPSRVVVGFVYAESLEAFGGHMWTEVFINGKWVPLDATLGRGGIAGGHIKLADTGFQDDGPAPTASFLPILRVIGNTSIQVKSVTYDN